jgi:hypothetical protein
MDETPLNSDVVVGMTMEEGEEGQQQQQLKKGLVIAQ